MTGPRLTLAEWFARTAPKYENDDNLRIMPPVVCEDGFKVSVQASASHHCTPRVTDNHGQPYTTYELGFPSAHEPMLDDYMEDIECDPTQTVYAYVPAQLVEILLAAHGGIRET